MQQTCNLDSTPSNRELKILDVCHIKEELTEVESVNAAHIKSEFGQTVKSINTESIDSEGFDSSNGAKLVRKRKFGCPFCKKLVRDISCHIRRCHVKEEEVQRALSKSTTSVERKRLLTMMRIRGMKAVGITQESRTDHVRCLFCGDSVFQFQDHCLKTHSSEPEVERIVHSKDDEASKRRKFRALRDRCLRIPQTTKVKCIHCGLLHSKRTLVKHIKNCSFRDKSETLDLRTVRKSCMTVTIHDSLDPRYRCLSVILGNTRQDDVTQIILNDRYLLELGKALIEMDIAAGKTPSDRLILKLRCLAKFLQTANKISSDALKSFRDVYIVSNYKYFKSSVIFMGDYVTETRSFSKPTLPLYVGSLVLHSSSTLRSILVKEGDTAAAQEVIRWKKLYRRDFSNSIKKLINKDLEFDHRHFLSNDNSLTTESGGKSSNESDCKIKITNISTLSTEDSSNFNQIKEDQMSNAGYIKLMDSGTSYSINGELDNRNGEPKIIYDYDDEDKNTGKFGERKIIIKRKHYCIYCNRLVINFARHLNVHKNVEEVSKIIEMSKGTLKNKALEKLRNKSDFQYNINNSPDTPVGARQRSEYKGTSLKTECNRRPCPYCRKMLVKENLYRHYKICKNKDESLDVSRTVRSKSLALGKHLSKYNIHDKMKLEVLPGMRDDEITGIVLNDSLILEYGSHLCQRYCNENHLINNIRRNMRQAGSLLRCLRSKNEDIVDMTTMFDVKHFKLFISAVKKLSGFSDDSIRVPSLAVHLGHVTMCIAEILEVSCIADDNDVLLKRVDGWKRTFRSDFRNLISKHAHKTLEIRKFNKPRTLSLVQDVSKLRIHLILKMTSSLEKLNETFDVKSWYSLGKSLLLSLIIFNGRRVGEVELIKLVDYSRRHRVQIDSEVCKTMTMAERLNSANFKRIEVPGKRARPVSILILNEIESKINEFLKMRILAGVAETNQFLFGIGDNSLLRGSVALREAAVECGASKPELLTGTKLRKYIATMYQAMSFTRNEMELLANHMGHNINTHKEFYRLPNDLTHLSRISLLLSLTEDSDKLKSVQGKSLDKLVNAIMNEDKHILQEARNANTDSNV